MWPVQRQVVTLCMPHLLPQWTSEPLQEIHGSALPYSTASDMAVCVEGCITPPAALMHTHLQTLHRGRPRHISALSKRRCYAAGEAMPDREILRTLFGYLWNKEHGFRRRIGLAMGLLVISKGANITVSDFLGRDNRKWTCPQHWALCGGGGWRLPEGVCA